MCTIYIVRKVFKLMRSQMNAFLLLFFLLYYFSWLWCLAGIAHALFDYQWLVDSSTKAIFDINNCEAFFYRPLQMAPLAIWALWWANTEYAKEKEKRSERERARASENDFAAKALGASHNKHKIIVCAVCEVSVQSTWPTNDKIRLRVRACLVHVFIKIFLILGASTKMTHFYLR